MRTFESRNKNRGTSFAAQS